MTRRRNDARGSTLPALMVTIAIMSIMLTVATQQWSFVERRELEKELIYRGERIVIALQAAQEGTTKITPSKLEDLTKPPKPTLRKDWHDPMTARYDVNGELVEGTGEWVILRQGDSAQLPGLRPNRPRPQRRTPSIGPIRGVHSSSELQSIGSWRDLPAGTPYTDWAFEVPGMNQLSGMNQGQRLLNIGRDGPSLRPPGFGGYRRPGGPPVVRPGQQQPGAGQQRGTPGSTPQQQPRQRRRG